ncbi:MAG: 16S rRNA (uracil(1498)-N(3))-methyltransferase [Rhodobacterales bacterium]|nr:16S rRNA (uracil(1498)-N(3))-methyltransferase [Rhodobacterales bacterium]
MDSDATPRIRLYVAGPLVAGAAVDLTADQAHYLGRVMRLGPGDRLRLFNGRDGEWSAAVDRLAKGGGAARAETLLRPQVPEPDVWLVFAALKKTPMDFVAEKATELGVARLIPVMTERTAVGRVNTDRLRANAVEAAEQCGRLTVPAVDPARPLRQVLADWPAGRTLFVADETGAGQPLSSALAAALGQTGPAPHAFLIGPEGGHAPAELDALDNLPFVVKIGLGPRILRAETAALTVLAARLVLAPHGAAGDPNEEPPKA